MGGGERFIAEQEAGSGNTIQNGEWLEAAQDQIQVAQSGQRAPRKASEWGQMLDQAGQALGDAAKKLGQQAEEQIRDPNTGELIEKGAKLAFPQLGALEMLGNLLGGHAAKREARALLNDPTKLANKMSASFDQLDTNDNDRVEPGELQSAGKGLKLVQDSRPVVPIMATGFESLAKLDENGDGKGITRRSVEIFSLVNNPQALEKEIGGQVWEARRNWGLGTAAVGLVAGLALKGGLVKTAVATGVGLLAGGIGGGYFKGNSLENYYDSKRNDVTAMIEDWKQKI